jgi:hypoxanthine phosphoribosyltransferase
MVEPKFTHAAEREVAHLLTYWGLDWQYEPRTFPIRFDEAGMPVESFAPDFWIPEFNAYLEITTARQCQTREKHRKVRLLRALHPEFRVLLYQRRDIVALLLKTGHLSSAGTVIGGPGQLTLPKGGKGQKSALGAPARPER